MKLSFLLPLPVPILILDLSTVVPCMSISETGIFFPSTFMFVRFDGFHSSLSACMISVVSLLRLHRADRRSGIGSVSPV